ncbi:LysR family transcriptional regulator [Actinocrispum wychmicini]|uniref:DNA-binding transcriptional LysR family regulator n=1 Tax=Actinocrispum wychmicini TaxID=1213861 RepID=A0A4R2IXT6_9PSEU|nr:LysR family transcriptional regulator [Actinocrispum wychmicini]TCO50651.1 DNA-binding transcriptional LysR family regulator [Actinocrispum wychmicini]
METRQFEYFVTVAEELSFTKAAQRLHAVQSTVSAAIKSLEAELGTTLFDRSTRTVALSPAGLAFLPEAKAALAAVEKAVSVVQEASAGVRGSLRIGTLTSLPAPDLPTMLGEFHRRYPLVDIHVRMSMSGSSGMADDLRHGRLDIALLGLPDSALAGLNARLVETRPLVALLPHTHPFARSRRIHLRDLAGEQFVDGPAGFGSRITIDRAFEALGRPRRVGIEVSDFKTIPEFVRAGLGIAIVPDWGYTAADTVTRPLTGTDIQWRLTIATRAGEHPSRALRTLLDLIDSR